MRKKKGRGSGSVTKQRHVDDRSKHDVQDFSFVLPSAVMVLGGGGSEGRHLCASFGWDQAMASHN